MSSIILATDTGAIYSFSVTSGSVRLVYDYGININDIDLLVENYSSSLAITGGLIDSNGYAYSINVSNGDLTYFGFAGTGANALEFGSANGQTAAIYGYNNSSEITVLDLGTGSLISGGTLPNNSVSAGDLEILGTTLYVTSTDGNLYGFTSVGGPPSSTVALGRGDIWGLAEGDGELYLFASNGDYYTYDGVTLTYEATLDLSGSLTGAASYTQNALVEGNTYFAGTVLDDDVVGTSQADILVGGLGDDDLDGAGGDDALYSGLGDDYIAGGAGTDTLYLTPGIEDFFVDGIDLGITQVHSLNGSVWIESDVEYVSAGGLFYTVADFVSGLETRLLAGEGWVYDTLWDYGWHLDDGWHFGWRVGWNQNTWTYGWNYGWNYGWQNQGAGWFVGWGIGWNVSWYFATWSYGWGLGWTTGIHYDFGWSYYEGWHYGQLSYDYLW